MRAEAGPEPGINGKGAVRRDQNEQKAEETNEVGVIDITRFIQKKKIGVAQAQKHGANPIGKSNCDEERENSDSDPMNINAMSRPRMHPGETVIFEKEVGLEPVGRHLAIGQIFADVPNEQATENKTEEDDRGDIDRGKGAR